MTRTFRTSLLTSLTSAALLAAGCGNDYPVRRVETPVNVTHEVAFGEYRRVYNTAYHILNRYGVIQKASYRYGEITALIGEDTALFDKTRRTIQARIFDKGDFYEVECRVLLSVEQSEVATFEDQFQPEYEWRTVSSDPQLEVRLNNEIRSALSGGAWQAKEPLRPQPRQPAAPPAEREQQEEGSSGEAGSGGDAAADTDEVRMRPREGAGRGAVPGGEAFERLGIVSLRHGAYDRAEEAFLSSIEADAEAPFAHYLLAQARFSRGAFDTAAQALDAGVRANPEWLRADVDVREFYRQGSPLFSERLGELSAAAEDDASLGLLLGYMRFFSGDPQGALTALDRYLEARPDDAAARAYRAQAVSVLEETQGLEEF